MKKPARNRRVLFVTVDFPPMSGGMSQHASGIVKGLVHHGIEVFVLAPRAPHFKEVDQNLNQVKIYRFPDISSVILRIVMLCLFVFYVLTRHRIRIVVNNTWSPCGMASFLLMSFMKVRYFIFSHGLDVLEPQRSPVYKKWMIRVLKHSEKIFPVSHFTAGEIMKLGISRDQVLVVPNGVDPDNWQDRAGHQHIVDRYLLDGKTVILTVSRLVKRKGHDLVLEAFKSIADEFPNLVYMIVGDGPEMNLLEFRIKALGLDDRVILTGFVKEEDLQAYYSLCDLFVLTPREIQDEGDVEGFGIVYLEANIMGKAVIGSISGGIQDAVVHDETGLLVPPNDPECIADAIRKLISDTEYLERLGKNGKQHVLQGYTWTRIGERLSQVIV